MRPSINVIKWTRTLPKPIRNGRFYRLGLDIALAMAGHANPKSGKGITATNETIAREQWCSTKEAKEARDWLEDEKWFVRVEGPLGAEWECNFDIDRGDVDEVTSRMEKRRADLAANSRAYRARMKQGVMTDPDDAVMTQADDGVMTGTDDDTDNVITLRHQRHQGESSTSSGSVIKSDDASDDIRRSQPPKSLKSLKVLREVEEIVGADAPSESDTLFESPDAPAPKPSLKNTKTGRGKHDYTPDFENAWATYERRGDKAAAFAEWKTAITRAEPATILAAIPPYLAANPDEQFRAHFGRWLAGDRWEASPGKPQRTTWDPRGFDSRDQWASAPTSF
jgi:hypothetical protein